MISPAHYAEAFMRATQQSTPEDAEKKMSALAHILRASGKERLLPAVYREIEKRLTRSVKKNGVFVSFGSARASRYFENGHHEKELAEVLSQMGCENLPREEKIDDTLVGGYKVSYREKEYDNTHKRALIELYTRITSPAQIK